MNCKSMCNVFYSSSIVIIEKRAKVEELKKNITFFASKVWYFRKKSYLCIAFEKQRN